MMSFMERGIGGVAQPSRAASGRSTEPLNGARSNTWESSHGVEEGVVRGWLLCSAPAAAQTRSPEPTELNAEQRSAAAMDRVRALLASGDDRRQGSCRPRNPNVLPSRLILEDLPPGFDPQPSSSSD
jgi:hypothetical protein